MRSFKGYLTASGQIHVMLLEGQFKHWRIGDKLQGLGLQLTSWCKLDEGALYEMFPGFAPRNRWGNWMNLQDWIAYYCCFTRTGTTAAVDSEHGDNAVGVGVGTEVMDAMDVGLVEEEEMPVMVDVVTSSASSPASESSEKDIKE